LLPTFIVTVGRSLIGKNDKTPTNGERTLAKCVSKIILQLLPFKAFPKKNV